MAFGAVQSQAPRYLDAYNIYQPYLRVQMSILTQNLPEPNFKPQRTRQARGSGSREHRRRIPAYLSDLGQQSQGTKAGALKIARTFGNDGRTVIC